MSNRGYDPMQEFSAEAIGERWDDIADAYAAASGRYGDINKEVLLTPLLLDMLGDVADKKVLDAGCGEGFLSRLLAERGAVVTGVDYSTRQLAFAVERTPDSLGVNYLYANLEHLEEIGDAIFDLVVSSMALQDIPDYRAALREIHRVLRPGGTCVLAITHPCFSSDGGWVRDEDGTRLYWKIDRYFYERGDEIFWLPSEGPPPINFHRTLTSYFQAILEAGFSVEALVEPSPSLAAIERHPGFINDMRMCHFLVFKLRHCSRPV